MSAHLSRHMITATAPGKTALRCLVVTLRQALGRVSAWLRSRRFDRRGRASWISPWHHLYIDEATRLDLGLPQVPPPGNWSHEYDLWSR